MLVGLFLIFDDLFQLRKPGPITVVSAAVQAVVVAAGQALVEAKINGHRMLDLRFAHLVAVDKQLPFTQTLDTTT
jgi:hypothetical protein